MTEIEHNEHGWFIFKSTMRQSQSLHRVKEFVYLCTDEKWKEGGHSGYYFETKEAAQEVLLKWEMRVP